MLALSDKDDSNNWRVVGTDRGNKLEEPLANVIFSDYIASSPEKCKDIKDFFILCLQVQNIYMN